MEQKKTYITTRKAAELLDISVRTAQLWVSSGALRGWKTAGGHRRILQESVDEILRQRTAETTQSSIGQENIKDNKDKFTILLVEDDPHLMKLFKKQIMTMKLPVDIITAVDGYSGLLATGQNKPDLIITDLMMPGMDGFRMIKTIKQDKQLMSTQFIVVSALYPQDIENNGGLPDDVQVLQKPVLFDVLEQAINSCYEQDKL